MPAARRVLVTGATGYIGGRLVPRLHDHGYAVRCFARAAHRLRGRFPCGVEIAEGSIHDSAALRTALQGCDVAYYLVHSMGSTKEFAAADREGARKFGECGEGSRNSAHRLPRRPRERPRNAVEAFAQPP